MEESELKKLALSVEGLCGEEECFLLYTLVQRMSVGRDVLEIGSFKGRVTVCLAKGVEERGQGGKVYSIDSNMFGAKEEFLQNIARHGAQKVVVPLIAHSARANRTWEAPVGVIWQDTDADYNVRVCDFILWEPYLLVGGILALSCADTPQVKRLVQDYIVASGRFEGVTFAGSVVYAYKTKPTPPYPQWKKGSLRTLYSCYYALKRLLYNVMEAVCPAARETDFAFKRIVKYFFGKIFKL